MSTVPQMVAFMLREIERDPSMNRHYLAEFLNKFPGASVTDRLQVAHQFGELMRQRAKAAELAAAQIMPPPSQLRSGTSWREHDASARAFVEQNQ